MVTVEIKKKETSFTAESFQAKGEFVVFSMRSKNKSSIISGIQEKDIDPSSIILNVSSIGDSVPEGFINLGDNLVPDPRYMSPLHQEEEFSVYVINYKSILAVIKS